MTLYYIYQHDSKDKPVKIVSIFQNYEDAYAAQMDLIVNQITNGNGQYRTYSLKIKQFSLN